MNRRVIGGKQQLLGLLCAVSLPLIFLTVHYNSRKTDFGDASVMGAATTSLFAVRGAFPIHCEPGEGLDLAVQGVRVRGLSNKAVWLGNSQLHAVNQFRSGERNAPDLLSERLANRSIDLITVSLGNANFQEHLILFHYLLDHIQPDVMILPVVFDDTREDGLRNSVVNLSRSERIVRSLEQNDIGRKLLKTSSASAPVPSDEATPRERSEAQLNSWLDEQVPLWRARPEMRGDLFISLYKFRNIVFGITPSSKRKIISGRYSNNMAAYEAILSTAASSGIRMLVYIAPIGSDRGERPYVDSEYRRFKEEIALLARKYSADLENFEDLIPETLWGLKDSTTVGGGKELDFMHFTAAGHRVLAEQIESKFFTEPFRAREQRR